MSTLDDYTCRQLIPRLLSIETANRLMLNVNSNTPSLRLINSFETHNYLNLKSEWQKEKSIALATQILAYESLFETILVDPSVLSYLHDNWEKLNFVEKEILSLANNKSGSKIILACQEEPLPNPRDMIQEIRQNISPFQRNPFMWCDLGYNYTKLGLIEKAQKAYSVAISLNNSNRFVVRSVARFYIHIGRLDMAHKVLTNSPSLTRDPGILSAEIALSEIMKKGSRFLDKGVGIISRLENSTPESNELFAQLATIEFSYGKKSKGRQLIARSLNSLTENSLAQFQYLSKSYIIDGDISTKEFSVPCQYEALTRSFLTQSNCTESLHNAKKWHVFQPFSSIPATFASFLSSMVFSDFQDSVSIIKSSLVCSPNSVPLKNNLAYAYARNNQVEEALSTFSSIDMNKTTDSEKAILMATQGMIFFKMGLHQEARSNYEDAILYFRHNDHRLLAIALYNYALVLSEIDALESKHKYSEVYELICNLNSPELNCLLQTPALGEYSGVIKTG